MTSKEALKRIKNKYKECLVEEAHKLPFTRNINIENIEDYWDQENTIVFLQLEKDLEVLEIIKKNPELVWWCCCYKNAYEMIADREDFMLDYDMKEIEKQFNIVKGWLEK